MKTTLLQVPLTIEITDVNDVAPRFSSPFGYSVAISEDEELETTLISVRYGYPYTMLKQHWYTRHINFQVSAEDPDSGDGGIINYAIIGADPLVSRDRFQINETTGDIVLVGSLDRELTTVITLTVTAEDSGIPGEHLLHMQMQVTLALSVSVLW